MDKLLYLKSVLPKGCELLIRTDLKTDGWLVHLFRNEYFSDRDEYLNSGTLFIKWFKDYELDDVLNEIEQFCLDNAPIQI